MAFPDLTPRADLRQGPGGESTLWAEATGVPDNGNNTFALPFVANGIEPSQIDANWIKIVAVALGSSVSGAAFVSLSADKTEITVSFVQSGADSVRLTARLTHTMVS